MNFIHLSPQQSVGDWLYRRTALSPDALALIDATTPEHRRITYREWNASANRVANFLAGLGVKKGDRVAVLAKNSVAYLDIWFALGKLGAILQNLNWRLSGAELAILTADAAPTVLIYEDEFAHLLPSRESPGSNDPHLVVLDHDTVLPPATHYPSHSISSHAALHTSPIALQSFPDTFTATPVGMEDPWVICYTGGTTGTPKGAVLTHGNIFWNSVNTVMSWGLCAGDLTVLNAPLFHTGGLNVFTAPLVHVGGASIVCRDFNPELFYDLLRDYSVNLFFAVPTVFIALQQHTRWAEADFSRLKVLISGGAPCPLPVFEKFWARGVDFKQGYGLTEAGPNTFWLPKEQVRAKPGAVGYPLFHVDVQVVDGSGDPCPSGAVGELLIRGPHVSAGYWNNPEATADAIRDGWLHTGDLAVMDSDGVYTIVGRSKEMFISGGENIYPAEIESVLAAHPAVAEVCVFGIHDERWGEVGCAFIVPLGDVPAESDLLDFCAGRLARYKLPRRLQFVAELPKTGAGKVDKKSLQDWYERRAKGEE
jgi:fatty-acyl-CoA synthase